MRWNVRGIACLQPAVTWVVTASSLSAVFPAAMKLCGPPQASMGGIHEDGPENRKGAVPRTLDHHARLAAARFGPHRFHFEAGVVTTSTACHSSGGPRTPFPGSLPNNRV